MVRTLVEAGSEVDARGGGKMGETPLHWAASSDDVAVLDALLDAGATIDAPGAIIAGGPPQWPAARRGIGVREPRRPLGPHPLRAAVELDPPRE